MKAALNMKKALGVGAAALVLGMAGTSAHAQGAGYPARPITVIVPFAAGGATDLLARQLGKHLSTAMGQPFVIENRAGAGGTVGARIASRAEPDGYTLIMGTNASHAIAATVNKQLSYDPLKDFEAISLVAHVPQVLMVHPSVKVSNVAELIDYSKKHPGELNFGSAGNGTPGHLGMELFKMMADVDMTHIPFQGGGPALFAPAGTPKDIVARLNQETVKALSAPEVRETLTTQGAEPGGGTPQELSKLVQDDIGKWSKVVQRIGLSMN